MSILTGFELWVPPIPPNPLEGDGENNLPLFEIIGTDAQYVQYPMKPGCSITCFSGAMAYMSDNISMSVKTAGFMKTFGRLAGGGSLFQVTYTNDIENEMDGYIAMTPDYPGIIVPINMTQHPEIYAMRDSFLCSIGEETQVGAGFNPAQSLGGFFCSGVDFVVQSIKHGEWSFLMAMGTVITKVLLENESILVDTKSVLCFENTISVHVRRVGGCVAMCCAGQGLFHTELMGPGKVWIQSMSIDRLRALFPPRVVGTHGEGEGVHKEEGSYEFPISMSSGSGAV